MQHTVPKFIEHEPKVVGPFTFKQFIFVGIAGAVCFLLYFTLGKKSLFLFILSSAILIGGALSLAFLKVGGRSLPAVLSHFFTFSISPKIYLWKKKEIPPPQFIRKEEIKAEPAEKIAPAPKIVGKSQLKKLAAQIETKTK